LKTLITNIKQLIQIRNQSEICIKGLEMKQLPLIENAFLVLENDRILDFGLQINQPKEYDFLIDANQGIVMPTWCDSHSHIVYASDRINEFVDRINGLSYQEIAAKGGGILNSAQRLNETDEDILFQDSLKRAHQLILLGTGALEIKSGYGLTVEGELKMLRVIKRLKQNLDIPIKATFLGAHAFPLEFKENKDNYIELIINEMLPKIATSNLADFIDVFLEEGYFDVFQTQKIIKAGKKYGIKAKIHVNQFNSIGGIEMCVTENVLSVDHLEVVTENDIKALQKSNVMPVALPLCSLFITIPYTPARMIIDAGLPIAIASDYNPGTCPTGNMNLAAALGCIKMNMTPEEVVNAATINGAFAMELDQDYGSITKGKKANLIITKPIKNYYELFYNFGSNLINKVIINGKFI
jgi:imidazolonepropionase